MRFPVASFINTALVHGIIILLLWFPHPLHFPTRADVQQTWRYISQAIEPYIAPETYELRQIATAQAQAETQRRIAQLPPALVSRAKPVNKVVQITCPKSARAARLHGSVFLVAEVTAHGTVGAVTVVESSPVPEVNQLIVANFKRARFTPALDEHKNPAPDQIHFNWAYDCRR